MSPEERAKELLIYMASMPETPDVDKTLAVFAAAITQAENDKLEEARQRILEGHDEAWGNPAEQHGWDQAAERVAALISKKD